MKTRTTTLLGLSVALATCGAFAANRIVDLGDGKRAAIFDEPGSFQFIVPDTIIGEASVLVVGGGGGGGGTSGGGGGGGQVVYATGLALTGDEIVSGVIGNGGAGGDGWGISGQNGDATTCTTSVSGLSYTALGGGGGAASGGSIPGNDGACGGGAGGNGTDATVAGGQATVSGGHPGGARTGVKNGFSVGSGGGGWNEDGQTPEEGSCGGAGYTTDISGERVMYAYGGGGGGRSMADYGLGGARDGYGNGWKNATTPATAGRNGTGGGGGGGQPGQVSTGGDGGCGTVIIHYTVDLAQLRVEFDSATRVGLTPYAATFTCTAEAGDLSGLAFTWDFGDGSAPVTTTDTTITHVYSKSGTFTVALTAKTDALTKTKTANDFIAVYSDMIYVDGNSANPVWPYATAETAATTLTNALAAVDWPGQTICVAPGFYDTRWLTVTNAVRIVGAGADPAETVLTNVIAGTGWYRTNWVLAVENADAHIANLTIASGAINSDKVGNLGACLTIRSGTVSNCVVRGGYLASATGNSTTARSAGVAISGAQSLLTHTLVENCNVGEQNRYGSSTALGAGAAIMGGARVENCLFRNIDTANGNVVTAVDGALANLTIVDCTVDRWGYGGDTPVYEKCYGLCLTNGTATARNIVIANVRARGDATENRAVGGAADVLESSFVNCATDTATPINATCLVGTRDAFFKPGTYAPHGTSLLRDAGVAVAAFAGGVDLAGNPRVAGGKIDIGCYECPSGGFTIFVR